MTSDEEQEIRDLALISGLQRDLQIAKYALHAIQRECKNYDGRGYDVIEAIASTAMQEFHYG